MRLGVAQSASHSFFANLTLFVAALVFCFSCQEAEQGSEQQELKKVVELSFDLEDQLSFTYEIMSSFNFSHVYKDSIEVLVSANKIQNSIDFYRLDNGIKIDSVMLSLEGPNGLPRMGNFLYDSDTIYITNPFSYEVILFDLSGIALKRIRIRPERQNESLLPRYFTPSQIVRKGDFVYLSGDPDLNTLDRDSYKEGKYMYEVNVKTGESRSLFDVPDIYHNDQWMVNQYFYRQVYDERRDSWLFSFEVDDSLKLYDLNERQQSFFAGSLLSGSIRKWNKKDVNSKEAYRYYLSNKVYGKLVYDKKHDLYYRFVKHPNREAMMNKDVDQMWTRDFSIVVLDKSLKWIGETRVRDKYIGESHISSEDGVYLAYFKEDSSREGEIKYVKLIPVEVNEED